jgi:ATP-binding cassette, subfamily C, bacterial
MFKNRFIIQSFGLFFNHHPARIIILFLITLFQGFSQGVTIVLLIPLLSLLDVSQVPDGTNKWAGFLSSFLEKAGVDINLEIILIAFTFCLLSVAVLNYFQSILQTTYQQSFSYEMRKRLFRKIIASDWEFLNGKSKHNHIQVLTTEIPKMTTYYYFFLGLASKLLFIIAHVVLAFMISFKFTFFVVIAGIIVSILLRSYLKKSEMLGNANIQAFRRMLKRIDDFWQTVKIAKVHHSESFYYKKYEDSNKQMLDYQNKQAKNRATPQLLFTLAGILTLVIVVYLGYSVIKLPLATLFILILLFARIFPQFSGINSDMNMLVSNQGSVRMVLEMDREIAERDFETSATTERIELLNQLEIRGLNFAYNPKTPLFVDFSASFPAKKITGIIGKSGCGKTTLLDIIAGLQNTDKPSVFIDGTPLLPNRQTAWKQSLGYLPQDSFFIDGTLRENLIWDTTEIPDDEQIFEVLRQVNAETLVKGQKNKLDTYIANYPYHFSGGERQRLALARVLLRKPKLLLLDEATSSLDTENEHEIMNFLLQIKKQMTIIFITHRKSLIPFFDKTIDING